MFIPATDIIVFSDAANDCPPLPSYGFFDFVSSRNTSLFSSFDPGEEEDLTQSARPPDRTLPSYISLEVDVHVDCLLEGVLEVHCRGEVLVESDGDQLRLELRWWDTDAED